MTQTDGELPTSADIRAVLGRAKLIYADYEKALTTAAVCMERATPSQQWELAAFITDAHHALQQNLEDVATVLGMPYAHAVESTGELIS